MFAFQVLIPCDGCGIGHPANRLRRYIDEKQAILTVAPSRLIERAGWCGSGNRLFHTKFRDPS
eukprot:1187915-Prorocentrum_minimum.AAC.3